MSPPRRRPPRLRPFLVAGVLGLAAVPAAGTAQEVPRDEYWREIPVGLPRLQPGTPASRDLHLFGDPGAPGYRDVDPRDGIDDARHRVLMALAVRFAPYLVQNTGDIPVNFRVYMSNRERFPLVVDRWEVTGPEPRLTGTREVNFSVLGAAPCPEGGREGAFRRATLATRDPALEDCKLLALLDEFAPGAGRRRPADGSLVQASPGYQDVLFFNMPGDGSASWKRAYRPEYEASPESLRAEFVRYVQDLDVDLDTIPLADLELLFPTAGEVPTGEGVHRNDILLGITLSF